MFSNVFQCYLLSFSLSLTISLFLTLTLFQSLIESLSTCWTTFVFISMLKTHSHTHSLSLSISHSFSLSHSFNLSFTHSRHAEQVLFSSLCSKVAVYRRKLQWFFFDSHTLSCDFWVHRAGSQLKIYSTYLLNIFKLFFMSRAGMAPTFVALSQITISFRN